MESTPRRSIAILPTLLALAFLGGATTGALAQGVCDTLRVSVHTDGSEASGPSGAIGATPCVSMSADGMVVAFWSGASNLVAGDTNGWGDIFVHERVTGVTSRVSIGPGGIEADNLSARPALSADGLHVAFMSIAGNLVPGDTNGAWDTFVHDRQTGTTTRVSVGPGGIEGNSGSYRPSLSADGRWVAFYSRASNLVPGDANGDYDAFVRDTQLGLTTLVSVDSAGLHGNSSSLFPWISADARHVAFESQSDNLVPGDTNGTTDVFVHDLVSGQTERVSLDSTGQQASGASAHASLSADGRCVAFRSSAADLVAGDLNGMIDVFHRDRVSGATVLVSVGPGGLASDGASRWPIVSADGRFVAFESDATTLVPGDLNGQRDAFVRDLEAGWTSLVSRTAAGALGDGDSGAPHLSSDGRQVAFFSHSTNLVAGDTNARSDVFVRECPAPPIAYCTAKTNSQGCVPAIGFSGAPGSTASASFDVSATNVLSNQTGLLFYGATGPSSTPFQGGLKCVASPTRRTPVQSSGGNPPPVDCSGQFSFDFNAHTASGVDPALITGTQVWAQYWSRDPALPSTTNLTDAVTFTIGG